MGWGTRTSLFGLLAFALVLTLALAPAAQAKRIVGTNSANVLKGTNVRDDIFGRDGKDVLIGFAAADYVYGEEGDDVLLGESGNDRLWGGGRDDTLDGGAGGDRLWPGWGSDVVDAGSGNDIVNAGENDAVDGLDRLRRRHRPCRHQPPRQGLQLRAGRRGSAAGRCPGTSRTRRRPRQATTCWASSTGTPATSSTRWPGTTT